MQSFFGVFEPKSDHFWVNFLPPALQVLSLGLEIVDRHARLKATQDLCVLVTLFKVRLLTLNLTLISYFPCTGDLGRRTRHLCLGVTCGAQDPPSPVT